MRCQHSRCAVSGHDDFIIVDNIDAFLQFYVNISLYALAENGTSGKCGYCYLHRLWSHETDFTWTDIIVQLSVTSQVPDIGNLTILLINTHPVKEGLISMPCVGIGGIAPITYTLVENNVERRIERPLPATEGIGVILQFGIREHFLSVYIPREQIIGPFKTERMVVAVGRRAV